MAESFIKFGFSAGVLAPELHGRGDLKNYDLGLKRGRNWVIDYRGGAMTRPGTEFLDYTQCSGQPVRLFPFQFNSDIANTYAIVFCQSYIRFLQDGAYVLESAQTIGTLSTTITIAGHGYSNGDWVKVLGQTYEITAATTNTFQLLTPFGAAVDLTGSGAIEVARVYSISNPYDPADFYRIKYSQDGDIIYFNHPDYAERKLTRVAATNWTLATTDFDGYNGIPASLTLTPSSTASTGILYAVTAVDENGVEGPLAATNMKLLENSVNFGATSGSLTVTWPAVAGAKSYRVYRSLLHANSSDITYAAELGYIGSTIAPTFSDVNITPDFTQGPLLSDNPFVDGAIAAIEVTAAGSGYAKNTTTVSVSGGGGSGFSGIAVVDGSGKVIGVRILNPGKGYVSPTVSFGGAGTGATATATATVVGGNDPACGAKIQQRRVRGGAINFPLAVLGSRVGAPDNYDNTGFEFAADPYFLSIDAEEQTPIRHILPTTDGMFVYHERGVTQIRGTDDSAITTASAKASPQTAEGASHVPPLRIDRDQIYVQSESTSVQALTPSNLPTYFITADRTIYSSHYFKSANPVVSWTWAKSPHRLVWAAREDGTFLSCAYVPEQEVWAWSDHTTLGAALDFISVRENGLDRVYSIMRRTVNGQTRHYIERLALREHDTVDEMWAVDSALDSTLTYPAASVTPSAYEGTITLTASASVFSSGDVGKIFRCNGGRGEVTAYTSGTQITVVLSAPIMQAISEQSSPPTFASGLWSLTAKFSSFSGLDHLEGLEVEILADGGEQPAQTVSGGEITLDSPASYVIVGLGFTGELQTLPPSVQGAVVEDKKRSVKGVAVRLYKARGLEFGDGAGDITYPLPARGYEPYGAPPEFKTGLYEIGLRAGYDLDGSITVKKLGPVAAQVLGLVMETDLEPQN